MTEAPSFAPNQALNEAGAQRDALIGDHISFTYEPRPSGVDYGTPSRRQTRRAGTGAILATGAALVFAAGAYGQEASPSFQPDASAIPSEDPITGLLDIECPPGMYVPLKPGPNASPSPEPTNPVVAVVNGREYTLIGDTVTVRGLAQEEPESTPAEPPPSLGTPEDPGKIASVNPKCVEINPEDYTLDRLLEGEYDPIDKDELSIILESQAPRIIEYLRSIKVPVEDVDEYMTWFAPIFNFHSDEKNALGEDGKTVILKFLQTASEIFEKDPITADAFMISADGILRFLQEEVDLNTKEPELIDKRLDKFLRKTE